jgi:hypothetical protein
MVMEKWNEDLSALHDGEMDELGAMRILRTLDQKPELLDQWELYSVIGDSLRQSEPLTNVGMKGAERALAVIAADQVIDLPQRKNRLSRPWLPLALAASLAILAVGLSLQYPVSEPVRALASAVVDRGGLIMADSRPADPSELDRYVDLHREIAVPGLQRASFVSPELGGGQQER